MLGAQCEGAGSTLRELGAHRVIRAQCDRGLSWEHREGAELAQCEELGAQCEGAGSIV